MDDEYVAFVLIINICLRLSKCKLIMKLAIQIIFSSYFIKFSISSLKKSSNIACKAIINS